jgi:hypothetical protein
MRMRKSTFCLLAAIGMATPVTASAIGIGGNSFQPGPGGTVQGTCNSIMGDIVNVNNLQNFQSALVQVIQQVGKAINTGQNQQLQAAIQQRNQQLQEGAKNLEVMAANQAVNRYHNQVSGINASGCSQASGAADTMNGIVSAQAGAAQITGAAISAEQPVANPLDAVDAAASATAQEVSAASLIPVGSATAPTTSVLSAYIKNAVAPINPQAIAPAAKTTPSGQQYQAIKHIADARESLATVTLGAVAKYNLPETKDTLAQQLWQQAGEPGSAPGTVNGKISDNGLLRVITDSRYASGNYAQKVMTHGDTWQLRQYAMDLAAQLRMELQEQDMLEHTLALQSAMLATQLQPDIARMNGLRGNALEQTANAPSRGTGFAPSTGAP